MKTFITKTQLTNIINMNFFNISKQLFMELYFEKSVIKFYIRQKERPWKYMHLMTRYTIVTRSNLCPKTGAKFCGSRDPTTGHRSLVAFRKNFIITINITHLTVFTNNEEINW